MRKRLKKLSAAVLASVMMLTAVATPLGDNLPAVRDSVSLTAEATTVKLTQKEIVDYAKSRVGGSYKKNYCLAFVADCFAHFGATFSSACCAKGYANKFIISTDKNIPLGADVFFSGGNVKCSNGHICGHIGIYVGNNKIVHASGGTIKETDMKYINMKYEGWGWHGNIIVSDNLNLTDHYKLTSPDGYQTIRKEASTSSANLGSINTGNVVCVTKYSSDNKWGYLTYNGISGWIRLYYVEKAGSSHSYGSWYTKTSATCTSGGVEERKCSCGKTETRSTSALGHNFGSTYYEAAHPHYYGHKCSRCGYSEKTGGNLDYYYLCTTCTHLTKPDITKITGELTDNSEINIEWAASSSDKLANYWLDIIDPDGNFIVDTSTGKTNSYVFTPIKTGTYTIKTYAAPVGNKDGNGSLSAVTTIEIDCNHNFSTTIINPTYDSEGYTLYTCTKCGYSYKGDETAKLKLSKVTGAKLTGRAADALRINWTKNANADGYIVEMYKDGKWVRAAKITNKNTTAFKKSGLKASTVYKFRVKAYKMSGSTALYGAYSSTVTARTNPSIVKGVKVAGKAKDALRLSWTKNTSAQGYIVEMYKGGKWVRVAKITNNNTTTFRKAGLAKNTAYKFRVRAYHMSGKTALYGNYGTVSGKTLAK